jgi:hypothetical protein
MTAPAIKGTLFATVVEELNAAIESGRLSRESLDCDLLPEDLDLLEQKTSNIGWFDIHAYHRLVEALWKVEAPGDSRYWFERGRRAARRLIESGIYQQLDYLGRTESSRVSDPEEKFKAFGRDMKLLMTLHASMLNFGDWQCVPEPDRALCYRIEIRGVEGVPDGVFMAAAGVFTGLGEGLSSNAWRFERPTDGLVLIRMERPL